MNFQFLWNQKPKRFSETTILLFLIFISLLFRFWGIASQSYWIDEMVSLHFASHDQLKAVLWDNHPPLHHLVLKLWMLAFGDSEVATRGLSTLISIATLVTLFRYIKQRMNLSPFFYCLLFCLGPIQIYFSQEARMFTFAEFFTLLSIICFEVRNESKLSFLKWVFVSILLVSTHYFGFLVLMAQLLTMIYQSNWSTQKKFTISIFLAVVICGALIYLINWNSLLWQKQSLLMQINFNTVLHVLFTSGFLLFCVLAFTTKDLKKVWSSEARQIESVILGSGVLLTIGLLAALLIKEQNIFFLRYFFLFWIMSVALMISRKINFMIVSIAVLSLAVGFTEVYKDRKAPWKLAAQKLFEQNAKMVYTNTTLAISTPYFKDRNIKVDRSPDFETLANSSDEIWFIDPYLSGLVNFTDLKSRFEGQNRIAQILQFKTEDSDAILVLHVSRKE